LREEGPSFEATRDTMQRNSDPEGISTATIEIENFPCPRFRETYIPHQVYIWKPLRTLHSGAPLRFHIFASHLARIREQGKRSATDRTVFLSFISRKLRFYERFHLSFRTRGTWTSSD